MTQEMKTAMFENMLRLEKLSEKTTYDGRDYFEQAEGAFSMLTILGLASEYVNWSEGK